MSAISEIGERYYREQALLAALPEWAIKRAREIVGETPEHLRDFKCYIATSTWVALALAAAAAGASYYNTQQTAKRQDETAAEGIAQQSKRQQEANKRVGQEIDDTANSSLAGAQKQATDQYLAQVQRSLGQANAGLTQRGLSQEFDERAGGAAAGNLDWGKVGAKLLGTIDGATRQRDAEAKTYGNAGMDLGVIGNAAQGDNFLNKLKLSQVRRNPYIDLAAGLMSGAAGGIAGGATGAGTAAATSGYSGMTYSAPATAGGASWLNAYGAG